MKKVSLLVLICMLSVLILGVMTSCAHTHTDAAADEICDECKTAMEHKTHKFGNAWAFDADNHYHVCDKCKEKSDSAAHADANNDGACDTCAVIMDNDHTYDAAWTSDATDHWHAPICGHDVEGKDKANHTFNAIGDCTVCGYTDKEAEVDVTETAKAIEAAALGANKISFGTVSLLNSYGWGSMISFEYGNNFLYTKDADNAVETYVTKGADGKYTYVRVAPNDMTPLSIISDADAKYYAGPAVDLSQAIGLEMEVYGAVELLKFFYVDFPATAPEGFETKFYDLGNYYASYYSFSYSMPITSFGETKTYDFDIDFSLNAGYGIENLVVTITDAETYETYYTIACSQSQKATNSYKPEEIIPTEFAIKDADGNVIDFTDYTAAVVDASVKNYELLVDVTAPATGLVEALGEISATVKDAEGNEVAGSEAYASYSNSTHKVTVMFRAEGTYYVNISIGDKTYVIPYEVAYATPTEITPYKGTQTPDYWGGFINEFAEVTTNTITAYTGKTVLLAAKLPDGCLPNQYTIELTGANAANATLTEAAIVEDADWNELLASEFSSATVGTYTVVFTSTVDTTVKYELTVEVVAPPTAAELAQGKWQYFQASNWGDDVTITLNFYPTNDTKGFVVVDYIVAGQGGFEDEIIYTYYINASGEIVTTFVSGDDYYEYSSIEINDNYNLEFDYNELNKIADTADTFTGEAPTVPDAPTTPVAPTPESVTGGERMPTELVIDNVGTKVYQTTVSAGKTVKFAIVNPTMDSAECNWTLTITVVGEVTAVVNNMMDQAVNAEGIDFNYDNYQYILVLTAVAEAEVVFTVVTAEAA